MEKATLRQELLQKRLSMPEREWQQRSEQLVAQLGLWLKSRAFQAYILYRSFRREPCLDKLAVDLPRDAVYYPRVVGSGMNFYSSAGIFEKNRWGLEEPAIDPRRQLLNFAAHTLLIVPAVAFDQRGYRLGYGGGFFDRFLAQSSLSTLGVCFDAFLLDKLPVEAHDLPVQTVVTEIRTLSASAQILIQ